MFENNKVSDALAAIDIIKSSTIEKSGLMEKILKLEYMIYNKQNDEKNMQKILLEIRKYDPKYQ